MFSGWSWSDLGAAASAVIALVALIRPEIGSFIARWKSSLELHPAGLLEVGFGELGPMVGMLGTLSAHAKAQFVSSVSLTVVRRRDQLRHEFSWTAFRPLTLGNSSEGLQIATGFLIQESEPKQFNILFADRATLSEMEDSYEAVRSAALDFFAKEQILLKDLSASDRKAAHEKFEEDGRIVKSASFSKLSRIFYWDPGVYDVTVEIKTFRPKRSYQKKLSFEMSEKESDRLRVNIIHIISHSALEPEQFWNWASVKIV